MANSNKNLFKRNIITVNKKLIFGVLLTFLVCIGSAILASYMTNPVDPSLKYPNPGHYPGEIGPGTFNDSNSANPYWDFPGRGYFDYLEVFNSIYNPDFLVRGNAEIQGRLYRKIDFSAGLNSLIWRGPDSINASGLASILNNGTGGNVVSEISKWDNSAEKWISWVPGVPLNDFTINNGEQVFPRFTGATTVSVPGDKVVSPVLIYVDSGYSGIFSGGKFFVHGNATIEGDLNVSGTIEGTNREMVKPAITGKFIDPYFGTHQVWTEGYLGGGIAGIYAKSNRSNLYSGYFTGGKGVKIEGDLNVSGTIEGTSLYFNPNDDDWVGFFAEKGTGAKFPGMKIQTYDGSNWRTPFEVSSDDYITIGDDGYIYIWLKNDVGISGDLNVSGTIKRTGYVKGDCDKNGVVNLKDVQCIDDYTNGLNTNCDEADVDCDINDDGLVDFMHDVLILGRILTGSYNAIDYLPFDSIASISPYAKFEAYENMPAIKADATGSTAYSGFFTGGKGVKIEGDLNVSGGIVVGTPTGGNKGAGTINAEKIYVNGSEVGGGKCVTVIKGRTGNGDPYSGCPGMADPSCPSEYPNLIYVSEYNTGYNSVGEICRLKIGTCCK